MNATLKTLIAAGILITSSPVLACDYPEQPTIPNGAEATRDEMMTASGDVKAYLAKVDEFLNCIEEEEKAALDAMEGLSDDEMQAEAQRRGERLDKRFDAANEDKALVGERFNQQVRAYNAKKKEEGG